MAWHNEIFKNHDEKKGSVLTFDAKKTFGERSSFHAKCAQKPPFFVKLSIFDLCRSEVCYLLLFMRNNLPEISMDSPPKEIMHADTNFAKPA